jgi:WD40 repeat protein/predicted Ser/Thr protein kinase
MRCLNCHYEPLTPDLEHCPRCKIHLPTVFRDVLPPQTRLRNNTYRLDYALGRGSFGITYCAHHTTLGERFAIKEFYPTDFALRDQTNQAVIVPEHAQDEFTRSRQRFINEARILAQLSQPNVVRVYDMFEERDTAYMVMDLIEGQTLKRLLKSHPGRKLPIPKVEVLVQQLVKALGAIHDEGVYHLDLKPENMILTPDNRLVLIDFGAARQADSIKQNETRLFTESYAPPEMMTGGELGPQTDLFELGMVVHQLITGHLPPNAMKRLTAETSWQPEGLIPPWKQLLASALQLRREDRPASIEEWWQEGVADSHNYDGKKSLGGQTAEHLRGSFINPDLVHDRQSQRLGRGMVRYITGLSAELGLAIAAGGTTLFNLQTGKVLWEIDSPTHQGILSPDEGLLILSFHQWLFVWELAKGRLIQQFAAHPQTIHSLDCSRSGIIVGTAHKSDLITLWQGHTGEALPSLKTTMGAFTCVAISDDSHLVAGGAEDGQIHLWERESGQEIYCLQGHQQAIKSLRFSPDGRYLASGSRDNTIQLWSMPDGAPLHRLKGHLDWVTLLAFSPDGRQLASAAHINDKSIRLWDVQTGKQFGRLRGHGNRINGLNFCRSNHYLISSGYDYTMRLWDLQTQQERYIAQRHTNWVYDLACSQDGEQIAAAYNLAAIQIWSRPQSQRINVLQGHHDAVTSVKFSADGRLLLSGSWDKTLRLWDVSFGNVVRSFTKHQDWILSVALSPDQRYAASAGCEQVIRLWDISTSWPRLWGNKPDYLLQGHFDHVTAIAFSQDSRFLISASKDQTVRLWEVTSEQEVCQFTGHSHHITCLAFSPDGQFVASGSLDKSTRFWHLPSRKEFKPAFQVSDYVTAIAYSQSGNLLAVGCRNGDIHFWDVLNCKPIKRIHHHTNTINCLNFHDPWLFAGDQDGVIRGWDLGETLQKLSQLE